MRGTTARFGDSLSKVSLTCVISYRKNIAKNNSGRTRWSFVSVSGKKRKLLHSSALLRTIKKSSMPFCICLATRKKRKERWKTDIRKKLFGSMMACRKLLKKALTTILIRQQTMKC